MVLEPSPLGYQGTTVGRAVYSPSIFPLSHPPSVLTLPSFSKPTQPVSSLLTVMVTMNKGNDVHSHKYVFSENDLGTAGDVSGLSFRSSPARRPSLALLYLT